jgi:hypothetical protein
MMRSLVRVLGPVLVLALLSLFLPAAELHAARARGKKAEKPAPSFEQQLEDFERRDGFLVHYLDRSEGRIWLELPAKSELSFLWVESLRSGLGSNPVGLDRGQIGETRLLRLRRMGPRVLFEMPNLGFRADSDSADERKAVEDSFARGIVWGAKIEHTAKDGRAWIDLTPFFLLDAHRVSARLKQAGQGVFALDKDSSAVDLDASLSFPENLEFEAWLTFRSQEPGAEVRSTAADPTSFGLIAHHSFVALPDDGYVPRRHDPRMASFGIAYMDYAVPLEREVLQRRISRHRLVKLQPGPAPSEVVEPIVYYVDRGAPEPIRSALVEGASWWAEAFEAAGFIDAFRVEVLPEGAHPLDIRYNVIQWVHRQTRGWSYGGGVVDPRSGEFIKGHVNLGSLRVRQDRRIFESFFGTANSGSGRADDPVQLSLARIRQLAAHEVGHTLGLNHNFAASTWGRASVMDYPAPRLRVRDDGTIDTSEAYAVGIGEWDKMSIRWAYSEFEEDKEAAGLEALVRESRERGMLYLTDRDARPAGAAHPRAGLWDNGSDAVEELGHTLAVRKIGLQNFAADRIAPGQPRAQLEDVLVPLYLFHRYEVESVARLIGGLEFEYRLAGEPGNGSSRVSGERQRTAIETLLGTLAPDVLDIPDMALHALSPAAATSGAGRERFDSDARPAFDPLAVAASASAHTLFFLLEPSRLQRMFEQHRMDPSLPGVGELYERLQETLFFGEGTDATDPRSRALRHVAQTAAIEQLLNLLDDPRSSHPLRARTEAALIALRSRLEAIPVDNTNSGAWRYFVRWLQRIENRDLVPRPLNRKIHDLPPGSPIGSGFYLDCSQ